MIDKLDIWFRYTNNKCYLTIISGYYDAMKVLKRYLIDTSCKFLNSIDECDYIENKCVSISGELDYCYDRLEELLLNINE